MVNSGKGPGRPKQFEERLVLTMSTEMLQDLDSVVDLEKETRLDVIRDAVAVEIRRRRRR